ncbi:50S ribosomal protein L35 [bacterium]|nr:50S ribosomal protein L35 [bacterium]
MPKIKTRKSASKRLKVTGTGKVVRHRAGAAHLQRKKRSSRKIKLRQRAVVGQTELKKVKEMVPGTRSRSTKE